MSAVVHKMPTAATSEVVSIKLIAQSGTWPQIDIGEREAGNPIRFQISAPHQDYLLLSHGQLAALVSAASAWLELFAPHPSAGDAA
jgi:hypothetical protein